MELPILANDLTLILEPKLVWSITDKFMHEPILTKPVTEQEEPILEKALTEHDDAI
jgi:hypothetical protein